LSEDKDRVDAPSNASELERGRSPLDTTLASAGVDRILGEGTAFGAYTIGPCIAQGRMARIHSARHEGLKRMVALKLLVDGFARNPDGVERFLREARNAAAIKHPNVVDIFDVGIQEDVPYLVMELLEGEDLATRLTRGGVLTEPELLEVMIPVVSGLAAVHDAGVLHRNLKPANIFIARGRNDEIVPKLVDFGISKAVWSDQLKLTLPNRLLMGTPSYMSPEAIRGAPMTALSDQYSLGVVMYECITGKNPCDGESFADTLRIITTGAYDPPTRHKPQMSRHLANIIARTMAIDPAERFADLRELGRELLLLAGKRTRLTWDLSFGESTTALSRRAAVTTVIELAPEAHLRTSARPRRRGLVLAAAALGTIGMLAAAVFLVSGAPLPTLFARRAPNPAPSASAVSLPLSPANRPAPSAPPVASRVPTAVDDMDAPALPQPAVPQLGGHQLAGPHLAGPSQPPARAATVELARATTSLPLNDPHNNFPNSAARRNADLHRVGSQSRIETNPSWLLPAQISPMQRFSSVPSRATDPLAAPMPQMGANNAPILD
jgi:eukaryotic-like serine/threonine-protein kinase